MYTIPLSVNGNWYLFISSIAMENRWKWAIYRWSMLSCLRRAFQGSTNIWFHRSVLCFPENRQNTSSVFRNHMKGKNGKNLVKLIEEAFYTLKFHQTKGFFSFLGEIYPFWRWNWRQNINLVKTWWKPGENLVKFRKLVKKSWNFRNLVKIWRNFQNLVKTWWNFESWSKKSEISKTWWKPGEI